MSKKKEKKIIIQDFTINDCANAPKPVSTIRKSAETVPDMSWDEIQDDCDIIQETNADGTKNFVIRKKEPSEPPIDSRPGKVYPEIVWYLISKHICPEDVGNFARINKTTYAVTKKKSFWLRLYKKYCAHYTRLPVKLRVDSEKPYGLRQTVIRALHHTYHLFVKRLMLEETTHENRLPLLMKRRCVNIWWDKGTKHWSIFFKLKKLSVKKNEEIEDFIEEMGRIDANSEEDTQVLQVYCQSFQEVPPVMGMTLCSVNLALAHGFLCYKLQLGFHSSRFVTKGMVPEHLVVLDAVVSVVISDWWQPFYPHGTNLVPTREPPLLEEDFFHDCVEDMDELA